MPDWSYHTAIKPVLFALPQKWSRSFVVRFLGFMTKLPFGSKIVDLLGHMVPPKIIQKGLGGVVLASPVGLSALVDPKLTASKAFEKFGFGFLCAGPVGIRETKAREEARRLPAGAGLVDLGFWTVSSDSLLRRLGKKGSPRTPLAVKIAWQKGASPEQALLEIGSLLESFSPHAAFFILEGKLFADYRDWPSASRRALFEKLAAVSHPALLEVPLDLVPGSLPFFQEAMERGVKGFVLGASRTSEGFVDRSADLNSLASRTKELREKLGAGVILFGGTSVSSPRDFLRLKEVGLDCAVIGSGLVLSGPGLPKRINEALESIELGKKSEERVSDDRPPWKAAWFWGLVLGGSMLTGSALALIFALTRVILPYDEAMAGITRAMLTEFNPKIVRFMTHDRATLAGTMMSVGALYSGLAWFAMRKGQEWAHHILVTSSLLGFLSFLTFLGSGYFDAFHGFVTVILFQFLILVIVLDMPKADEPEALQLDNDGVWKRGLWGQALFIVHGFGLVVAGLVIGIVGMTHTFVPEDLEYLGTTAEAIRRFHPSLIPLIAHDRETFGNMLVCAGVVILLSALWGFRYRRKWLWWIWLAAGYPPYVGTLAIHFTIGYENWFHLMPVFVGLGFQTFGLILCRSYLAGGGGEEVA